MNNSLCCAIGCSNDATTYAAILHPDRRTSEVSYCADHAYNLGKGYLMPDPAAIVNSSAAKDFEDCRLDCVLFNSKPCQYAVILRSKGTNAPFVVNVGYVEACCLYNLAMRLHGSPPGTHELIVSILHSLGAEIREAVVDGYDAGTHAYTCYLALNTQSGRINVRCRGSDAVCVSLLTRCPLRLVSGLLGRDAT